ncbi:uncharacterized protein LOC115223100 [Argonauta hians]
MTRHTNLYSDYNKLANNLERLTEGLRRTVKDFKHLVPFLKTSPLPRSTTTKCTLTPKGVCSKDKKCYPLDDLLELHAFRGSCGCAGCENYHKFSDWYAEPLKRPTFRELNDYDVNRNYKPGYMGILLDDKRKELDGYYPTVQNCNHREQEDMLNKLYERKCENLASDICGRQNQNIECDNFVCDNTGRQNRHCKRDNSPSDMSCRLNIHGKCEIPGNDNFVRQNQPHPPHNHPRHQHDEDISDESNEYMFDLGAPEKEQERIQTYIKLAKIQLDKLHLKEQLLLEKKRQQELERIRPPKAKWYGEIIEGSPNFTEENIRNREMMKHVADVERIRTYRKQLLKASRDSRKHFLTCSY